MGLGMLVELSLNSILLLILWREKGRKARKGLTEVSSKVDSIARLPSKTSTDAENDEEQHQRCQVPSSEITVVLQCVDAEHQDCGGDELGEELAGARHEGGRVGAEDAGGGVVGEAGDGADVGPAFVDVNCGFVVPWLGRFVSLCYGKRCGETNRTRLLQRTWRLALGRPDSRAISTMEICGIRYQFSAAAR